MTDSEIAGGRRRCFLPNPNICFPLAIRNYIQFCLQTFTQEILNFLISARLFDCSFFWNCSTETTKWRKIKFLEDYVSFQSATELFCLITLYIPTKQNISLKSPVITYQYTFPFYFVCFLLINCDILKLINLFASSYKHQTQCDIQLQCPQTIRVLLKLKQHKDNIPR